MPFVYMFTFPNNKKYIGQTNASTVQKRWNGHRRTFTNKNDRGYDTYICRAFRKHKWENVIKEVLVECTTDELDEYEIKYIEEYNSLAPNGYNRVTGGNRNRVACQGTKDRMRVKALKRFTDPAAIAVISNAAIKRFANPVEKLAHSKRMRARPSKSLRKFAETKYFPKYLRIGRNDPNSFAYVVRNHPYSPRNSRLFSVSKYITKENAYKHAFAYVLKLDSRLLIKKLDSIINQTHDTAFKIKKIIHNFYNQFIQEQGSETKR